MPWTVKLTMAPNHLTFVCQTMCQAFYMHYILLNLDPCNAFISGSHAPNPVPPPKPVPLTTEQVSGNPSEQQGLSPGKAGPDCLCTRGRPSSLSGAPSHLPLARSSWWREDLLASPTEIQSFIPTPVFQV